MICGCSTDSPLCNDLPVGLPENVHKLMVHSRQDALTGLLEEASIITMLTASSKDSKRNWAAVVESLMARLPPQRVSTWTAG